MPTTKFPLTYLRRLIDATPEQMEQQAFEYGLEATLNGDYLEVEVTAERPDLLAAEGFARAINIYNGVRRTVPDTLADSGRVIRVSPSVQPLRPFIAALVVENLRLEADGLEALIQFQEKVTQTFGRQRKKMAIGVYDGSQIMGDLDYTAAHQDELSVVPLFGETALTARQILTEHPNGRLYASTLPEGDWVPVLRDAEGTVLALPPIINAAGAGQITAAVSSLLIDVTGISAKTVMEMVNILAHNFLDSGAEVKTVTIAYPEESIVTPTLQPKSVPFSAKFLNEMVGTSIAKTDLNAYLDRMDLHATGTNTVLAPTYRTDIFSEIDIAGDLLVAVGIDQLTADFTALRFYNGLSDPLKDFTYQVGDLAQRMGLMEVKSLILSDPDLLNQFASHYVQTANAKSRTYSAARVTLQAGLLEILSHNINAPKPINIYEIGEVLYLTDSADSPVYETLHWGFASLDARASFATAKAYVQTILTALGIPYDLTECQEPRYIAGRAATVIAQGQILGHFGEIHPAILDYFSFPEPVCSGELDCQRLRAVKGLSQQGQG